MRHPTSNRALVDEPQSLEFIRAVEQQCAEWSRQVDQLDGEHAGLLAMVERIEKKRRAIKETLALAKKALEKAKRNGGRS